MTAIVGFWSRLPFGAKVGVGVGVVALTVLMRLKRRRAQQAIHKKDYRQDLVYLYQFPSCRTIVTVSPFALKVETWLRWKKVPYETIRGIRRWSKYGQIPFIELNGQQIADSNVIIQHLQHEFNKQDDLSIEQKSVARAFEMMLENQTVHSYFFYRYVEDASKFLATWEFLPRVSRFIVGKFFPKNFRNKSKEHGIGRHSDKEIYDFGIQDIRALEDFLGDKKYFFGDSMATVDCYLFGHLCQILFIPVDYPHKEFMLRSCPKLVSYVHRLKDELWPDWDEVCERHYKG